MATRLRFVLGSAIVMVVVATGLVLLLNSQDTQATNIIIPGEPTPVATPTTNASLGDGSCPYNVRFDGVFDNKDGTFTWKYTVISLDGPGCGLSHWVIQLCNPQAFNAVKGATGSPEWSLGVDDPSPPNTGLKGLKWNGILDGFTTGQFAFTLTGNFPATDVAFGIKVGAGPMLGTTQGPDCVAFKQTPTPTNTPPIETDTPTPTNTPPTETDTPTPTNTPPIETDTPTPTNTPPTETDTPTPTNTPPTETDTPTPTPTVTPTSTPEDPKSAVVACIEGKQDPTPVTCKFGVEESFTIGGAVDYGQDLNGDTVAGWQRADILVTWAPELDPLKNSAIVCPAGSVPKVKVAGPGAWQDGCQGPSTGPIQFVVTLNCTDAGTFKVNLAASFIREDGDPVPPEKSANNEASVNVTCNVETVGGLAVDLDAADESGLPLQTADSSGMSAGVLAGLIAGISAVAIAMTGAAWYARRRRPS